ncbi:MAG: DNA recombination protein RmuC [Elusimicrobia bacterium]|nr:MAG: DNA recombination protein RmuC [Elusimicrobiota bacterium]
MQDHLAQILVVAALILTGLLAAVVYLIVLLRSRGDGGELAGLLAPLQQDLTKLDTVLRQEFSTNRTESQSSIKSNLGDFRDGQAKLLDSVAQRVQALSDSNDSRFREIREAVDKKLSVILEQLQKDLMDMQKVAGDVGALSRVLSNVKARGVWGEIQLERILQEMLTPAQFERNYRPKSGTKEAVEFAVRLPGPDGEPVFLPVDSKLPREDYERLVAAQEKGDLAAVEAAAKALEATVKAEARSIRDKYINPPQTTDFAVLFLPVESLYAEVLRRPGLVSDLQSQHRIVVAGPTTFSALLNSLLVGFRSVVIQKRAVEIQRLLAAVKTEMGTLSVLTDKIHDRFELLGKDFEAVGKRAKLIERKLKGVDALPESEVGALLENGDGPAADDAP